VPRYSEALDLANRYALYRDWMAKTAPGIRRVGSRSELRQLVAHDVLQDRPIDYLEFGVYQGESISAWTKVSPSERSRFFGFDSFEGLPEDWDVGRPKGAFDLGGRAPVFHDARVRLLVGDFRDTLPTFLASFSARSDLVVHIDSDLYSSAMYCLTSCRALLVPGTVVIFDEFPSPLHEFRAFSDFCLVFQATFSPLALVGSEGDAMAFQVSRAPRA
jgi:O-methyltransferase